MALQEFARADPGSKLRKAVKKLVIIIKFKFIMIILSKAKSKVTLQSGVILVGIDK